MIGLTSCIFHKYTAAVMVNASTALYAKMNGSILRFKSGVTQFMIGLDV